MDYTIEIQPNLIISLGMHIQINVIFMRNYKVSFGWMEGIKANGNDNWEGERGWKKESVEIKGGETKIHGKG